MAKKAIKTKKAALAAKSLKSRPRYVCCSCGTEVVMDCCGIGFRELICCDKAMGKKMRC